MNTQICSLSPIVIYGISYFDPAVVTVRVIGTIDEVLHGALLAYPFMLYHRRLALSVHSRRATFDKRVITSKTQSFNLVDAKFS